MNKQNLLLIGYSKQGVSGKLNEFEYDLTHPPDQSHNQSTIN